MSEAIKSVNELNADLFVPEETGGFADPGEARKKAMDYLARREYGQRELVNKLTTAGFEAEVALQAVERLTGDGLQNDRRFIEGFTQSRINQGKGSVRLRADLRQRGIDSGLIDEVLLELATDWRALAREVRSKKFGLAMPQSYSDKAKQMRFLQYRGFSQAEIESAMGDRGDDY
jgi:regulatory protein